MARLRPVLVRARPYSARAQPNLGELGMMWPDLGNRGLHSEHFHTRLYPERLSGNAALPAMVGRSACSSQCDISSVPIQRPGAPTFALLSSVLWWKRRCSAGRLVLASSELLHGCNLAMCGAASLMRGWWPCAHRPLMPCPGAGLYLGYMIIRRPSLCQAVRAPLWGTHRAPALWAFCKEWTRGWVGQHGLRRGGGV